MAKRGRFATFCYEFLRFGAKQGWACLFGALLLGLAILTRLFYPAHAAVTRLDFLFVAALLIQAGMLGFRLETLAEARVILTFHITGMGMEIFKTAIGSWEYPEPSHFHVAGVPLFTGFMYAATGSYLFRVWRLLDFRFSGHPPLPASRFVRPCAGYLCEFFLRSLPAGSALYLAWGRGAVVQSNANLLSPLAARSLHASICGLFPGGIVHLVCREYRHLYRDLALSKPERRLVHGFRGEIAILISVDAGVLHAGGVGAAAPELEASLALSGGMGYITAPRHGGAGVNKAAVRGKSHRDDPRRRRF